MLSILKIRIHKASELAEKCRGQITEAISAWNGVYEVIAIDVLFLLFTVLTMSAVFSCVYIAN